MDDILQKHSKFIVFLSHLLLLFSICPVCQTDNPLAETYSKGTMVEFKTTCKSTTCPKKEHIWKGQPEMEGTKMPARNFLLCFALLLSRNSAYKVPLDTWVCNAFPLEVTSDIKG